MKCDGHVVPGRVLACDPERGFRDIRGVDLAAGAFLGDGDRDGPRAGSDVEHDARVASGVYAFQGRVDDALGVRARDEGLLVEVEDQVPEVRVAQDALHGLALQAAGDPGLVERRLLGCQLHCRGSELRAPYAE